MKENTDLQHFSVVLSREELLAVLVALHATTIPGLEREPSGQLTPEQEAFAIVVARRALMARNLAQIQNDGTFLIHRELLRAVGTCAYARSSVLVYHWPSGEQTSLAFFGHVRENDVVIHTRPGLVLHRFTLVTSLQELVEQVLSFCEVEDAVADDIFDFFVPRQELADARQLASVADTSGAVSVLARSGVSEGDAAALIAAWAANPRVSAMQTIARQNDQMVKAQEFTLIQDGQRVWWIAPATNTDPKSPMHVRTTSVQAIRSLLISNLSG